jgi:hypothetical protein
VLVRYRAGHAEATAGKVVVAADQVNCTANAKADPVFACDINFHGGHALRLTGVAASEVFAGLELVGSDSGAAFVPGAAAATAVRCTLDAKVLARGVDGGAGCTFSPTAATAAPPPPDAASTDTPAPVQIDDARSLLIAALVGAHDATLSAADKAVLAAALGGRPASAAAGPAFAVSARRVLCTSNLHNNLSWSCDLSFAAHTVHLTAAPAADLYAALMLTGFTGSAAMGVDEVGAAPLTCRIDPAAIAAHSGGAACTLTESE